MKIKKIDYFKTVDKIRKERKKYLNILTFEYSLGGLFSESSTIKTVIPADEFTAGMRLDALKSLYGDDIDEFLRVLDLMFTEGEYIESLKNHMYLLFNKCIQYSNFASILKQNGYITDYSSGYVFIRNPKISDLVIPIENA